MKPKRKFYEAEYFENLRDLLNNTIKQHPNNTAFVIKHNEGKKKVYTNITYSEFKNEVESFGTGLIDLGLKDARVAIIGKNRYEWALTYITVLNGVGITVPLDKGLPEEEIKSLLRRSKANCIVFEKEYAEIMQKIKTTDTELTEYICMDDMGGDFKYLGDILKKGRELLEQGDTRYLDAKIDPDKMATIIFTSGTTSTSKAVMLSHKNFTSNVYDMNLIVNFRSTDVNIAFLPFHHTFGSTGLLMMLANGVANVFCDGLRYVQDNLKEYGVSVFVCVPLLLEAMYKKIMTEIQKQGKEKLITTMSKVCTCLDKVGLKVRRKVFKQVIDNLGGKLRLVISGASGIDKNVAKGFHDFGILTLQGYGLTETSPVLAAENATALRPGSCGVPMQSVDIKINEPNEEGIGEIIARRA